MSTEFELEPGMHIEEAEPPVEDPPEAPPKKRGRPRVMPGQLGRARQALEPKPPEVAFRSPLLEPSALPKRPPGR